MYLGRWEKKARKARASFYVYFISDLRFLAEIYIYVLLEGLGSSELDISGLFLFQKTCEEHCVFPEKLAYFLLYVRPRPYYIYMYTNIRSVFTHLQEEDEI